LTADIRIGTAGWSLPRALAEDFPGAGSHLERYARRMNAVEVNTSFYRPHKRAIWERWAAATPEDFRFSVKTPRLLTHDQRLMNPDAALDVFAEQVAGLGDKLSVLLVQLPPSLMLDVAVVGPFLTADEPGGWTGLSYARLHGSPRVYYSAYSAEFLTGQGRRLQALSANGPVWCILDNTASGAALGDALTIVETGKAA
jgi:uncharacterized protein YecE (DUF72 family)